MIDYGKVKNDVISFLKSCSTEEFEAFFETDEYEGNPLEQFDTSQLFYHFDKRGVRCIVSYGSGSGGWKVECYRKKTKEEIEKEPNLGWRMVRVGHIPTYNSRMEAEIKAFNLARRICQHHGY